MNIKLVNLIEEDFVDYCIPGMFLGFPTCSGKCNEECGEVVCQNQELQNAPKIDIPIEDLLERYCKNSITKALIFGGLEPFDSFVQVKELVKEFYEVPEFHDHHIVIYTGYYPNEIREDLRDLYSIPGSDMIIIKFGRYMPGVPSYDDPVLHVRLSSANQFAMRLPDAIKKLDED
jgi:hypothetical protein